MKAPRQWPEINTGCLVLYLYVDAMGTLGFSRQSGADELVNRTTNRRYRITTAIAAAAILSQAHTAYAAGTSLANSPSGKAAGLFASIVISALVIYSLILYARPLIRQRDRGLITAGAILLGLWIVKTVALYFFPGFHTDIGTYEAWSLRMASLGPARFYRQGYFADYPPGYQYVFWWAGWFAQQVGASGDALRLIVETPALAADFLLAALLYVFFRRSGKPLLANVAMLCFAFNPAMLFDTVVWGQTDSALTLVMLLSALMILEEEYELGWALAALSILIKPQAFALLPVIGLWTLLKADWRRWIRGALAFWALMIVGAAPFQIGHSWEWLPKLYLSGAAYYHETSVNAFNLMALLGGIRQPDSTIVFLGLSYFTIGMGIFILFFAFVAWILVPNPTRRNFLFASFIAMLAFFMLAPRIHERYLYPAVAFAIPLAMADWEMMGIFVALTFACLFNLAYSLHTLDTTVFMPPRDTAAMTASAINVLIFAAAVYFGWKHAHDPEPSPDLEEDFRHRISMIKASLRLKPQQNEDFEPIPWLRIDTVILTLVVVVAAAIRFWRIGSPAEIVFDEVYFVGQARHYLHGEPFLDPHPPIAKLLIALGIRLFGDHPWSWRLGNATMGTILAGVTYLLGRRMFRSRLAGTLAAAFVLSDGMFLVDSRIAVIDIVYVTFAAISYLSLFRFVQTSDPNSRRWTLVLMGVALGLCLGSKLYVPGITFLLVTGFVAYTLWRPRSAAESANSSTPNYRTIGAILMLGGISAFFYLGSFIPHYYLGWWGGIQDLFHYYAQVIWYEKSVANATHPYASPWWSWPLMLRPVAYWENFPTNLKAPVAEIWAAGNVLLWWAVIPAMAITAVRALERPNLTRGFIVIGYLSYYVIWIPITRILFLYHYMPSVYIGYLALAGVVADLWQNEPEAWETVAIFLTMVPALIVGLGHAAAALKPQWLPAAMRPFAGVPIIVVLALVYVALLRRPQRANRFIFVVFLTGAFAVFLYFFPLWVGLPISRAGYYARMWFEGPGIRNWI